MWPRGVHFEATEQKQVADVVIQACKSKAALQTLTTTGLSIFCLEP